jgi:NAD(P)-dependent dehydrogenase (short-subunit alcohol dehydrogenase family)
VVHPTNVATDMLFSEPMYKAFRPDLEHPTRQDAELAFPVQQGTPIPCIKPADISNAVLFLASDEARCITGIQLRVDFGGSLKWHDFHLQNRGAPLAPRRGAEGGRRP